MIEPGTERMPSSHPGEHLAEFLQDCGLSARALGRALGIPHNRVLAILAGRRSITAETALRLGRYFGTSAEMWINLQARHDLELARVERGEVVAAEVAPRDEVTEPA
ncbi:MAG: HigA family addiction module antidote protein [Geminicoccaceae bacterium]|nr:HigA family addiction module antidote protein [Geminicoccaceae bacterium]